MRIRAPQRFYAGLFLIGLCLFVFWAIRGMPAGTVRMMGAAMFPRILATMIGLSGLALVVLSLRIDGEPLERVSLRAPFFVTLAVIGFALTIRTTGLAPASFLALALSGFATPEAKPREVFGFAVVMTVLGVILFHYLLGMSGRVLIVPFTQIRF